jgi:hypothetical protein
MTRFKTVLRGLNAAGHSPRNAYPRLLSRGGPKDRQRILALRSEPPCKKRVSAAYTDRTPVNESVALSVLRPLKMKNGLPVPTGRDGTPENFIIVATCPARWHPDDALWYDHFPRDSAGRPTDGAAVFGLYTQGGTVVTVGTTDWAHGLRGGDAGERTCTAGNRRKDMHCRGTWERSTGERTCRGERTCTAGARGSAARDRSQRFNCNG